MQEITNKTETKIHYKKKNKRNTGIIQWNFLKILDSIIVTIVITPIVVAFWNSTWHLVDLKFEM